MSKEKSKIGRYTHSQRTETIREVNKLEGKAYADEINIKKEIDLEEFNVVESLTCFEKPQIVSGSHVTSGEDTLTEEETGIVNLLIEMMDAIEHFGERGKTPEGREQIINEHYERYIAKVKLIGPLKAIPKEEYFTLLKLYNIDLDGRWNLFKQEANNCAHIVERYCKFAYTIPGFQTISLKDQETLLKIGHCDFFIMLMHEGYDHERQIFLEMNGIPAHVEEAADKIFSRDLIEQQCKLFRKWQQANLLKEELALLCAMSLLCSDRVELENPEPVEKIHSDLTAILMKVLKKHHGKNAEKRFSKFIDNLTLCRQGSEMYFKEYQEMSNDNMVQQAAPAFPTLCPDNF
jgi:prophage maintenance system killer protein